MHDYADLFGAEGPLATAIPGFATREEQIAMAEQVALALRAHGRLIVEAGTGTGKTFAYLVPAPSVATLLPSSTRRCCPVAASSSRPARVTCRISCSIAICRP